MHPAFLVFAGQETERKEAEEIARRCARSHGAEDSAESLTDVQEDLHRRGIRAIHLVRSTSGWYIRYASGLDDFSILRRSADIPAGDDFGFSGARDLAIAWVARDPERRYAFTTAKAWETGGKEQFEAHSAD